MWIVPFCRCAVESAGSNSECPPQLSTSGGDREWWVTSSGTPTLRPASWRGWKMRHWRRLLCGAATYATWMHANSAAESMCCAPACHASHTALPGHSEATQTPVATAPKTTVQFPTSCESFPSVAPPWYSSKTCLPGFQEDGFDPSAKNYADWVTRSKTRSFSLRKRLVQRIGASGCLCWPTPNSRDHKGSDLASRNGGASLPHFVETGIRCHSSPPAPVISTDGVALSPTEISTSERRRLNPAFVCWLMGSPWWWTRAEPINFAAREMALYRSKLLSLLSSLLGE